MSKTETLPAGWSKEDLLSTLGVDVTTGINSTKLILELTQMAIVVLLILKELLMQTYLQ